MKTNFRIHFILILMVTLLFKGCKNKEEGIEANVSINDITLSIDENVDQGVEIGVAKATTTIGNIVYSISSQSPQGAIEIDQASGAIQVLDASLFDFESHESITAVINATVEEQSETSNLVISIHDLPETVNTTRFVINIDENPGLDTNLGPVAATTDGGVDIVFSLLSDLNGNAFNINSSTGELTVALTEEFDFEKNSILKALYKADNGVVTEVDSILVELNDIAESVTANPFTITIDENPNADQVLGTVSASTDGSVSLTYSMIAGEDAAAFSIDPSSGELSVDDVTLYDFESAATLSATYRASNGTNASEETIIVTLNDVAEAITANPITITIDENPDENQVLGKATASADGVGTLSYSMVSGDDASAFAINSTTGEVTVADVIQFDYENKTSLKALYQVSNGSVSTQSSITVNLNDVAESVTANPFTVTIDENPSTNQVLGSVSATADGGATLSYSLVAGEDASAFEINSSTGQLLVADMSQFDYETKNILTAKYQVSNGSITAQSSITVNLNDIAESVVANPFDITIDENPNTNQVLGTVSATADGATTLSYSMVAGGDASAFAIDATTGELTVADVQEFDYESKTALTANYQVSSGSISEQGTITVNLNDAAESVTANPFTVTIDENPSAGQVLGTVSASADGDATITYSIVAGQNGPAFNINSSTGELSVANEVIFDYENSPTILATYEASTGTRSTTSSITINLNDVFEAAPGSVPFITTWQTTAPGQSITIPTNPNFGTIHYDFTIDWGDGTVETNQNFNPNHSYANAGTYTISITGKFAGIYIANSALKNSILSIEQWGNIEWQTMENAFWGCQNLSYNATDTPDLLRVRNMNYMFAGSNFNADISAWDVSNATSMQGMFTFNSSFNQDISSWDVGNVTSMRFMFDFASAFNQNIGSWNIENVSDMTDMLKSTNISVSNYDGILDGWANQANTPLNISLGAGGLFYSTTGEVNRDKLITQFNWSFVGDNPQ